MNTDFIIILKVSRSAGLINNNCLENLKLTSATRAKLSRGITCNDVITLQYVYMCIHRVLGDITTHTFHVICLGTIPAYHYYYTQLTINKSNIMYPPNRNMNISS